MSESVKLTKAQRRTLARIADGYVVWSNGAHAWTNADRRVLCRLQQLRLIQGVMVYYGPALTDAGREALAASQETER